MKSLSTKLAILAALLTLAVLLRGLSAQTSPTTSPSPVPAIPLTTITPDGKPHAFKLQNKQFTIDGQPTLLIAGEMHFGRILPEDFELRVKQAKAMGLNALSFYLFWNRVEPEEGKFDFTGMNDIRRMFKLCQDNGLWVILRPGPYCCAEVEYGGIPYWTLKYPEVKIRTNDPQYVAWSKAYIEQVYKQVADLQVTKGGPLLMVQTENEYGMVAAGNYDYLHSLNHIFKDAGFEVPLFVCDPGSAGRGAAAGVNPYGPDVLRGRNGLKGEPAYQQTSAAAGDFPVYAPEVYTAWFTGWGQPIATKNAALNAITSWTTFLLDHHASWCYYMFYGGTNWGFSNGCNEYLPVQTSYDYGAPIDEAGRTTEKYRALRTLLTQRLNITPPPIPPDPPIAALPAITFQQQEPLLDYLPAQPTLTSIKPVAMENLNQAYGFVLYRKKFPAGVKGKLELRQAMDYTLTMINGKTVGKSFIGYGPDSNTIALNESGPVTLDLLVYNLGRVSVIVNAAASARAHKGLIGGAFLDGQELAGWDIYSLPMTSVDNFTPLSTPTPLPSNAPPTGPTLYRATFNVENPAGTFLDMRNWHFGVVWVNGHNLGRYWDRGALRSLFLPAAFLKPGANDITILELHEAPANPQVTGGTQIVEEPPLPFAMRLDVRTPTPLAQRGPR